MQDLSKIYPVADLHCDLLSYLTYYDGANAYRADEIGCAIPFLKKGKVNMQGMAIFSTVEKGSTEDAYRQSVAFKELLEDKNITHIQSANGLKKIMGTGQIGVWAALESASGLCEEDQPLDKAFDNYERIEANTGKLLYISMTHHDANRFGGGNYSQEGLKPDGEVLLDFINGRKTAIDLSHTSDSLAYDILDYIDRKGLEIPVIASHSNFRPIWKHVRNLPDDITQEIIRRDGLIGMNFLRAFVHNDHPEVLLRHILYGLDQGAEESLSFGADFFCVIYAPNPQRIPYYFPDHEDSSKYPSILNQLRKFGLTERQLKALAHDNFIRFVERNWG